MGNEHEKQRGEHADHNKACADRLAWSTGFSSIARLPCDRGKEQH